MRAVPILLTYDGRAKARRRWAGTRADGDCGGRLSGRAAALAAFELALALALAALECMGA